jgi:hypothetical protein
MPGYISTYLTLTSGILYEKNPIGGDIRLCTLTKCWFTRLL